MKVINSDILENSSEVKDLDSEKFWVKAEMPSGKIGFIPAEVTMDANNKVSVLCPRPNQKSILRFLSSKPLPEGTVLSLAFQNENLFELWSGEVSEFVGVSQNHNLDEYEITTIKQEMASSERAEERFNVSVPLKLRISSKLERVYEFAGCSLSKKGIGLWFPNSAKSKIKLNEVFQLTFQPREVEPFTFNIKCIRPHCEDTFSNGFVAGFIFTNLEEDNLATIRLNQLIEARGKLPAPEMFFPGHYLASFYENESFGDFAV